MEYLVDWNCHLMPGMREHVTDPNETIQTMQLLFERFAFTHFCLMPEYDCTREPISVFLLRFFRATELLKSTVKPQMLVWHFQPCVMLAQNLHLTENLVKLTTKVGTYLPIHMPIADYSDWIDFELNRLLYQRKVNLWFVSFEQCVLLYPPEVIEKLINIQNAVYQFAYKSLINPNIARVVKKLVKSNKTVLFGSMVDCLERAYQFDFPYYEKTASELLTPAVYQTVIRQNRYFWTKQMH